MSSSTMLRHPEQLHPGLDWGERLASLPLSGPGTIRMGVQIRTSSVCTLPVTAAWWSWVIMLTSLRTPNSGK